LCCRECFSLGQIRIVASNRLKVRDARRGAAPQSLTEKAVISGEQDWGTYQRPGVYEAMQATACTRMLGCHLVAGAGHWVQQEQPEQVSDLLLQFVKQARERLAR
jgi:pimeloyl-ACP methyl ester carboxylesterase